MAIVKFSSKLHSAPSIRLAGNAAVGLWTSLVCWTAANRGSNGMVPTDFVKRQGTTPQIRRMVLAGLATETPAGYRLNDDLYCIVLGDSRPWIPNALRELVYERDGWACLECGTAEDLSLDHIFPWSLGGPDTAENLQTLCRSCNSRKGAKV